MSESLLLHHKGASQETSQRTAQESGTEAEAALPVVTRLLLLGRLAQCVRGARLPLTSAVGGQTLLQWLRAAADSASAAAAAGGEETAAVWYDCAADLMRLTPLVLPLQGRLGPLLVQALADCHRDNGELAGNHCQRRNDEMAGMIVRYRGSLGIPQQIDKKKQRNR